MRAVIGIVVAIVMGVIAYKKGFSWWLWILAGGIPGFIVLLCMPSASAEGIDEETRNRRRKNGNTVGAIISVIVVILMIALVLWMATL